MTNLAPQDLWRPNIDQTSNRFADRSDFKIVFLKFVLASVSERSYVEGGHAVLFATGTEDPGDPVTV
jgi:hypothetical protein